jgi:hypothetical protein
VAPGARRRPPRKPVKPKRTHRQRQPRGPGPTPCATSRCPTRCAVSAPSWTTPARNSRTRRSRGSR